MSALHLPTILPLFIKNIDPDQTFLPLGIAPISHTSPSSASHEMTDEYLYEKKIHFVHEVNDNRI